MVNQKEKESLSSKPNLKSAEKDPSSVNPFLKYTGLGFQMLATILMGVFGGIYIDEYFGLEFPVFTACLSLLAVIGSMYLAIKELIR